MSSFCIIDSLFLLVNLIKLLKVVLLTKITNSDDLLVYGRSCTFQLLKCCVIVKASFLIISS